MFTTDACCALVLIPPELHTAAVKDLADQVQQPSNIQ